MITISGVIGAGKTSLTSILAKHLGTHPFYEVVKNNPVLPLFYKGNQLVATGRQKTNPYVFLLQIYFLNIRFKMMKQAMQNDCDIMDRSIYEDRLFMKLNYDLGNTTKTEWHIYQSLLSNMMQELPYAAHKKSPDLMIYIKVNYHTMLQHIERRGRAYEQPENNTSLLSYYQRLIKYYRKWSLQYDYSPIITIDGDKYDFVNNRDDRQHVIRKVDQALKKFHVKKH